MEQQTIDESLLYMEEVQIEDFDDKDQFLQEQNIELLGQSLVKLDQSENKEMIECKINSSKQKWKLESDSAIDFYQGVQKQMSYLTRIQTEETCRSWKIFNDKIKQELESIYSYIYLDLASDNLGMNDVKYVLSCLDQCSPRLQKFLVFLNEYEYELKYNQGYCVSFDLMMNLEDKMQQYKPKVNASSQIFEDVCNLIDITFLAIEQISVKKKILKKLQQSKEFDNLGYIQDQKREVHQKIKNMNLMIRQTRKALYGQSLMSFAGEKGFSKLTQEVMEEKLQQWCVVPVQLEDILDNISKSMKQLTEMTNNLQKEVKKYITIDEYSISSNSTRNSFTQ